MNHIKSFILLLSSALILILSCKKDNNNTNKIYNLDNRSISSIVIDNSNIRWVGTDTGLFRSEGDGYILESTEKILSMDYEKNSDTLWIGTESALLKTIITGGSFNSSAIPPANLSNNKVNVTYIDSSSRHWFGTDLGLTLNKSGVFKKAHFLTNKLGDKLSLDCEKNTINSITSWDGDYYFATNGYSICRAYKFNDTIDAFSGASFLATPYNGDAISDTTFVLFTDSHGNIWMGGTQGIQEHSGHDIKANNTAFVDELPSTKVHSISEAPDGKIWVGTENGIAVFNGNTWTTSTVILKNPFVTAIAFDKDGSAWVGTKNGLVKIP